MASAIDHEKHRDSSSLDGKVDGHGIHSEVINPLSDLPDPDAGLSEEERAAAVCPKLHVYSRVQLTRDRTRSWSANSTSSLSHGCLSFTSSVGYDRMARPGLRLTRTLAFLDRTNIGNAKVDGLQDDLKMTNGQYNATLTIFFVSYAVFEPLTNVLLKKMRPSIFLPLIMVGHQNNQMYQADFPARLGYRHGLHGPRAQLLWNDGLPILPWTCRGRTVPGR